MKKWFRRIFFWFPFPPSVYLRMTQPEEALSMESKKQIIALTRYPEWKQFEEYLKWKMGVATRQMFHEKALEDDRYLRDRRVEVGTWAEITQDLRTFWIEMQRDEGKTTQEMKDDRASKTTFEIPNFPV